MSHDLHVASVLVHYRLHTPELVGAWVGEDCLPGIRGAKNPDALLMWGGRMRRVIEIGGSYGVRSLEKLIDYGRSEDLEVELW